MSKRTFQKVTIQLDWTPNTYYIGVYVARKLGFFANEELDVAISSITDESVATLVGNGTVEFGYYHQESLTLARAGKNPIPIVAIGAFIPHNTTGFAGLLSTGIHGPKDFEGKRYGKACPQCMSNKLDILGSDIEKCTLDDVMSAFNGDVEKVTYIKRKYGYTSQAHFSNNIQSFCQGIQENIFDFAWIFEGWQGINARIQGLDLFYIPLIDVNPIFDYYMHIIISSQKYLSKNPDVSMRFMHALKKGYEWSVKNPEESARILYEAEPSLNKNLVIQSAFFLAQKFIDDAQSWGIMKQGTWENYTHWLREKGFIDSSFSIEGAFTNEFVRVE